MSRRVCICKTAVLRFYGYPHPGSFVIGFGEEGGSGEWGMVEWEGMRSVISSNALE